MLRLPKKVKRKRKSNATTKATNEDGSIDTHARKQKKKRISQASSSSKKVTGKKSSKNKAVKKSTKASQKIKSSSTRKSPPEKVIKHKKAEVIELIEDSDESDSTSPNLIIETKTARPRRIAASYVSSIGTTKSSDEYDVSDDDSISEFEFEG